MTNLNKILVAALGLQLLIAVLIHSGGDATGVVAPSPYLAGFDADKVDRIEVYDQRDTELGGRDSYLAVVLVRTPDRSGWVIENAHNYPALTDRVDTLLGKLGALQVRTPMATGEARRKQLEVDEEQFERKLVLSAGGQSTTIFIGLDARSGRTAVRLGDSSDIYGVTDFTSTSAPAPVRGWVEVQYIKLGVEALEYASVVNSSGTFEFTLGSDGKWATVFNGGPIQVEGRAIAQPAVDSVLFQVANIAMAEPAAPKTLDGAVTVTLRRKPSAEGESDPTAREHHLDFMPHDDERMWVQERGRPPVLIEKADFESLFTLTPIDLLTEGEKAGGATPAPGRPTPPAPGGTP